VLLFLVNPFSNSHSTKLYVLPPLTKVDGTLTEKFWPAYTVGVVYLQFVWQVAGLPECVTGTPVIGVEVKNIVYSRTVSDPTV